MDYWSMFLAVLDRKRLDVRVSCGRVWGGSLSL